MPVNKGQPYGATRSEPRSGFLRNYSSICKNNAIPEESVRSGRRKSIRQRAYYSGFGESVVAEGVRATGTTCQEAQSHTKIGPNECKWGKCEDPVVVGVFCSPGSVGEWESSSRMNLLT